MNWKQSYIQEDTRSLLERPTALLVIDAQNDFLKPNGKIAETYGLVSEAPKLVKRLCALLSVARDVGIRVIYTRMVYKSDYSDAGTRARSRSLKALKEGTWGSEIIRELPPKQTDDVINKQRASAFYNTNLELVLRGYGIKTLIITGVATNICVESTAREAMFRDFDCIIVRDCVASGNKASNIYSLRFMNEFVGKTVSSRQVINVLRESSQIDRATHSSRLSAKISNQVRSREALGRAYVPKLDS